MYPGLDIKPDEIFVSDGSKCDIGKFFIALLNCFGLKNIEQAA